MEMLRRHLWVIDLAGIALGAVVSGQAAASLMASVLPRPQAPHAAHAAPPRPKPVVDSAKPAIDGIVGAEHLLLDVRRCCGSRRASAREYARADAAGR